MYYVCIFSVNMLDSSRSVTELSAVVTFLGALRVVGFFRISDGILVHSPW
jgi:hypothetical protein